MDKDDDNQVIVDMDDDQGQMARFLRRFSANETIFEAGDPGDAMFVVQAGTVEIRLPGPNGPTVLARIADGEFFGEMALVDDGPRSATAVAGPEGTVLLAIDTAHFVYLVSQQPAFALIVLGVMARRLRAKNEG